MDRSTWIEDIVENKKFQIRTDKKIDNSNDIRWTFGGPGWFTFTTVQGGVRASKCVEFAILGDEPFAFLQRAGEFTFLKTSTQLQVWFDDILEVTWDFKDKDEAIPCAMKKKLNGLKFEGSSVGDTVSTHYRYQTGKHLSLLILQRVLKLNI